MLYLISNQKKGKKKISKIETPHRNLRTWVNGSSNTNGVQQLVHLPIIINAMDRDAL